MAETTDPNDMGAKKNADVRTASETYVLANPSVEMVAEQSFPEQGDTVPVSDAERAVGSTTKLHESEVPQEEPELALEGQSTDEISEKYEEIEEEYEEQLEEDGEVKFITKKRVVRVKKISDTNKEIDKQVQPGTVIENEVVHIPSNFDKEESSTEKENEYEKEEVNENEELKVTKKTQSVDSAVEKSASFEEIEKENDEKETNEIITVPKAIEGSKEDIYEVVKEEKLQAEGNLEEEAESNDDELEEEDTSKSDLKKEEEEEVEDTVSVSGKKSVASLSSAEVLLAEEKLAMAQQYEILSKLRSEHTALKRKNYFLNNKLVQYFRKQKMDHVFAETKEDPALEQQYLKKLMIFYETNQQMTEEKLKINTEWETQRSINEALAEKVKQGWQEHFSLKKEIAAKLIDPKTGRTVPCDKGIEDLLNRQEAQLQLISECRLAQIKLKRRIEAKKIERQLQHAGKEFNLMDYEKLASLNEYYTDKITETDIAIEEVSQKLTAMDDTLIQVREQLQKKEEEMEHEQEHLHRMALELNNKRTNLNTLKATRHKTEKNTAKIKQQSGLLAYPGLLKDYEEKSELLQLLMSQTEALKQAHRAAVAKIRKLREIVKQRTHDRGLLDMSPSTITFSNINNTF